MLEKTLPVTKEEAELRAEPKVAAVPVAKKERLLYIDNLRMVMIMFVVIMHAAVTYGGMGSWYYKEPAKIDPISFILFGIYQAVTQGYFMGLLFLLAGYFVPGAYDRKGFGRFMKDRLIRLGIPALLYMLVIEPFIGHFLIGGSGSGPQPSLWSAYAHYIISGQFIGSSGPLWFAIALLIFTFIYGLVRLASGKSKTTAANGPQINLRNVVLLILAIGVGAFAIRLVQPLGTSVLNMQLGYFSSYIALFIVGIKAYRYGWLSKLDGAFGRKWLIAALTLGIVAFLLLFGLGGAIQGNVDVFSGGLSWQAAAFALWEAFIAVAMSIGLLALFRERYNRQSRLVKVLSDNAFCVYVFHAPVLISISLLLRQVAFLPIVKWVVVSALALAAVFTLAALVLRRTPLLKEVL